jgi:precorrin-3B synthase
MVGGRPPLGRLDPQTLRALAECDGELRLTPWQSVLVIGVEDAEAAKRRLDALGLVTDADAPLASLIACSGSTGCRAGRADTQGDALKLAARLDHAAAIHLSGCEKSCAAARALPVTLIAVAPGRYDLYRRHENQGQNRVGRRVGAGLGLDEIADRLASGA